MAINAFRARGAALSPDGRFLYTFGGGDAGSAIRVLSRDRRTGLLTPVAGRAGSIWANTPTALALSPDGRDLFVTAYSGLSHRFAAFRLDPRTGTLAKSLCCVTAPRAVTRGDDVVVSPDGRNLYIASAEGYGHGLAILTRDPITGLLIQPAGETGCIQRIGSNGCAASPTASFAPARVVVSGDGTSVYVISNGALFSFLRSITTGQLTGSTCYEHAPQPPCVALPLLASVTDVLVSGDGRDVYLLGRQRNGSFTDAIAVLQRQDAQSALVLLPQPDGCLIPGEGSENCRKSQGLNGEDMDGALFGSPHQLAASADGRTVYLARTYGNGGSKGAGIVMLARDAQTGTLRQGGTLKIGTLNGGVLGATALPSEDGNSLYATEEGYPGYRGNDAIKLFRASQ